MTVRIVIGLPEVVGWLDDSLRSTRGIWMAVRIVWGIPEVVGWQQG